MNKKQKIKAIKDVLEPHAIEVKVGYHAELQSYGIMGKTRGCYAEMSKGYGMTTRMYAKSYSELLKHAQRYAKDMSDPISILTFAKF